MNMLFGGFLAVPVFGVLLIFVSKTSRQALMIMLATALCGALLSGVLAAQVAQAGVIEVAGGLFRADHFSAWHMIILAIVVFLPSSVYAYTYFEGGKGIDLGYAKRFGMLWLGAFAAMSTALLSGNIGIMWVAIEASTLFTAFLIFRQGNAASLEAMWKYIIMCSVGVAFAFIGTLLMAAAGQQAGLEGGDSLLLQKIYLVRGALKPSLALTAFIFILVGYGTKAGLAPMHNWLPDAHSQAPGPVSAMFSGFLLNAALYCILRFLPLFSPSDGGASVLQGGKAGSMLVGAALASSKAQIILMGFALLSLVISSAFIFFQKDAKRMLAYCSVEHMGIIAFAYALGPVGTIAGLFHTLNHSFAKTAGFFSAGSLGKKLHTNELARFSGASKRYPLYAIGFAVSLLALIGVAPFSVFMSEFMLVSSTVAARRFVPLAIFLAATSIVFLVMLKHAIAILWKSPPDQAQAYTPGCAPGGTFSGAPAIAPHKNANPTEFSAPSGVPPISEYLVIGLPLAFLLVLGLWMPHGLSDFLTKALDSLWSMK